MKTTAVWVQLTLSSVQVGEAGRQALQGHIDNALVEFIAVLIILGAQAVGYLFPIVLVIGLVLLRELRATYRGNLVPVVKLQAGQLVG